MGAEILQKLGRKFGKLIEQWLTGEGPLVRKEVQMPEMRLCLARTPSEAKTARFHAFVSELHLAAASIEIWRCFVKRKPH